MKRTKNQVSKDASLPCKTNKTTGCTILPHLHKAKCSWQKDAMPLPPRNPTCFISFRRSFFADILVITNIVVFVHIQKKRVKACQRARPGVLPVKWQRSG